MATKQSPYLHFPLLLPLGLLLSFFLVSCQPDHPTGQSVKPDAASKVEPIDESLKSSVKANHLIETADVKKMYDKGQAFKVIEISKEAKFEEGHLAGAVNFWRPDYEGKAYAYGDMRASPEEMAALLGDNGISPDDYLVIYDTKGSVDAIRFMWILDMYGHERMAVMNGGKAAWKADGFELTREEKETAPVLYAFSGTPDYLSLARMEDVLAAMKDTNCVLVDTREPEEYHGLPYIYKGACYPYKKGAFTYGRIPGSVHLNWSDAVDLKGDHRFKSLKDLKYNFKKAGVTPDKKIIAYCQSGARSAHTLYVLTEILGYENVQNYDGSWIEWSYNYMHNANVAIERDIDDEDHKTQLAELKASLSDTTE
jgi:thiosulfate/3-mercaptopyruvate sulfurtransferase